MGFIQKIRVFFGEIGTELRKVSWSNREELMSSTTVVLLTIFFMTLFVGVADIVFSRLLDLFLRV